jgi:tRNA pseudouridine55 synthase
MLGLLNIHKPTGMTSRDVVNRIQRFARPVKVGHAGTLDPLAEGVLIVAVGSATRLIEYVQRMRKTYRGQFEFGWSSDTEDTEGTVVPFKSMVEPTREELESALPKFIGSIEQVPPAYSALKVKGKRAYAVARAGSVPELAPRTIVIYRLTIVEYSYPRLVLEIDCGQGTYVRSLGRDLAKELGTSAVMSGLIRLSVGEFRVSDAVPFGQVTRESWESHLLPIESAVSEFPSLRLTKHEMNCLSFGQAIERPELLADEYAAFSPSGQLASIVVRQGVKLFPKRNLVVANSDRSHSGEE